MTNPMAGTIILSIRKLADILQGYKGEEYEKNDKEKLYHKEKNGFYKDNEKDASSMPFSLSFFL